MIHIKSLLIASTLVFTFSISAVAQSITGTWKTIDDKTGNPVSHIKITEKDGKFYGRIIKLLPDATITHCNECDGEKQGKPLEGLQVLWELEPHKDYWSYGKILDPASGKTYKCSVWLEENNTLKVRGYIGISLFGRSQNGTE